MEGKEKRLGEVCLTKKSWVHNARDYLEARSHKEQTRLLVVATKRSY